MLESLRRRFRREVAAPLEYIIPCRLGPETRGVDAWDVHLRLGSLVPVAAMFWWAAAPDGATRSGTVGLVVAGAAFVGRSTVRWVRIRHH
ncbi:hypothetical protein [Embleya sp. NPDC059237]|uniref:hypothetical protein n=1 Tax=Embleya sp. NPDC059237 TaxID=3346784 RepID=UPI0036A2DDE3